MTSIATADFDYISELARSSAAIVIEKGKEYLVESRLVPLAHREGFTSLSAFISRMRDDRIPGAMHARAVDALTTNETLFFRDYHPYEALRTNILQELIAQRSGVRKLTIWSAACSTGQEPFSIAMLLREHFPELSGWKVEILATDYSQTVLNQASAGRYNQVEVNRGLPASYLLKYFTKEGEYWIIKEEIRRMVEFRQLNLVQPWPILPPFDLIMARNVMIYFEVDTKRSILAKLRNCILPHGALFLGAAETTINLDSSWKPVTYGRSVAYRLV